MLFNFQVNQLRLLTVDDTLIQIIFFLFILIFLLLRNSITHPLSSIIKIYNRKIVQLHLCIRSFCIGLLKTLYCESNEMSTELCTEFQYIQIQYTCVVDFFFDFLFLFFFSLFTLVYCQIVTIHVNNHFIHTCKLVYITRWGKNVRIDILLRKSTKVYKRRAGSV